VLEVFHKIKLIKYVSQLIFWNNWLSYLQPTLESISFVVVVANPDHFE